MYKELTSRRSDVFLCLLIRVSRVRTPDRALTITVFTDIGAVGTVIFLYIRKVETMKKSL